MRREILNYLDMLIGCDLDLNSNSKRDYKRVRFVP